jgi:hypothetical protein
VRVNTALWLIDNDEDLHIAVRDRLDFEGVRGWFDKDDEESFHRVVSLYCDDVIDELTHYIENEPDSATHDDRQKLSLWKQKKIEAELRIIYLTK